MQVMWCVLRGGTVIFSKTWTMDYGLEGGLDFSAMFSCT